MERAGIVVRGEVVRYRAPRGTRGQEQRGACWAVVVQADELALSTVLICPTSTAARATAFRPSIELRGVRTRVLVEQTTVVARERLGESAGRLTAAELQELDEALALVLGL